MNIRIIKTVHHLFIKRGLTLSTAESCTGGLIAHYLTSLPGSSRFFEAGVVSYSTRSKKNILDIPDKTISEHGVVSKETALIMAKKIRLLTKTDVGISTTGNLGPEVLEGKPKGLIYIAISTKKGTVSKKLRLNGTRAQVKEKASVAALKFIIEVVAGDLDDLRGK